MKLKIRLVLFGILFFADASFSPWVSGSDDFLLDMTVVHKQYLIELSGTVMNETFAGAQALLTVMPPSYDSTHPYQIMIQGFPQSNSRNSFYWHSDLTEMTAIANEITSEIKRTIVKSVPMHFFFLSPTLLNQMITPIHQEEERKRQSERMALPTRIEAQAGKLKLQIYSNSVSGTIWIKGYDKVEKAYVQYNARFYGKRYFNMEQSQIGIK